MITIRIRLEQGRTRTEQHREHELHSLFTFSRRCWWKVRRVALSQNKRKHVGILVILSYKIASEKAVPIASVSQTFNRSPYGKTYQGGGSSPDLGAQPGYRTVYIFRPPIGLPASL